MQPNIEVSTSHGLVTQQNIGQQGCRFRFARQDYQARYLQVCFSRSAPLIAKNAAMPSTFKDRSSNRPSKRLLGS